MDRSIALAVDVDADAGRVFEILSTTRASRPSGRPTAT